MGMMAIIVLLALYLLAARQVTDTNTPRIRALVHDVLQRNLAKTPRTALQLRARTPDGGRHYELTLHPAGRFADDPRGVQELLQEAARMVHEEVGARDGEVLVTCVALLPAGETRVTYDRRMHEVPEPEYAPEPPDGAEE